MEIISPAEHFLLEEEKKKNSYSLWALGIKGLVSTLPEWGQQVRWQKVLPTLQGTAEMGAAGPENMGFSSYRTIKQH